MLFRVYINMLLFLRALWIRMEGKERGERKRRREEEECDRESEEERRERAEILHGDSCALGLARSNHAREIYGGCFRVPLLSAGINIISNRLIPI